MKLKDGVKHIINGVTYKKEIPDDLAKKAGILQEVKKKDVKK